MSRGEMKLDNAIIAVLGLGYVGLPLAVEYAKLRRVIGFDIDKKRVSELKNRSDKTGEVEGGELEAARYLSLTSDPKDIREATVFIVTVPSPIDANKQPDLSPLKNASATVASALKSGDIVVYESTVYPGCTEEECVPVIEQVSGLRYNEDFFVGYSPERINPGDKTRKLPDITKITSGSTPEVAEAIDELYRSIIKAGTYKAQSIKVAEAAKVIENTQRDLNIALANELSIIFGIIGIDTNAVLEAASTKWNFNKFYPGLVGGHCIGVDPYYLTYKAQQVGYFPEVVLAGRRLNDGMSKHAASLLIKTMIRHQVQISGARILVMGLTFKENCPDIRNTKVVDLIGELEEYGAEVDVYDPIVDSDLAREVYGLELVAKPMQAGYQAVILAVPHNEFLLMGGAGIRSFGDHSAILFDLKSSLPIAESCLRL